MADSEQSKVYLFDNSDAEMQRAYQQARVSFGHFWREIAWDRRRIVPALDMACVKAPFMDDEESSSTGSDPQVEHMWMSDIDFNGRLIKGTLMNKPNWLKSVSEGDTRLFPISLISDWMYVINGEAYGAFSVNLLRSRMGKQERQQHDSAWGLNFGDPLRPRVVPRENQSKGLLQKWFGKKQTESEEHPMSVNMAESLKSSIESNPKMISEMDDEGWTLLHQEALAGSAPTVKVLLEAGADASALTKHGMTPLQLAQSLNWETVVDLLSNHLRRK